MNKGCKIALIGCGVVVLLGIVGSIVAFGLLARHVTHAGGAVADFTVPPGYKQIGASVQGMTMVQIMNLNDPVNSMTFQLMQPGSAGMSGAKGGIEELAKQTRQAGAMAMSSGGAGMGAAPAAPTKTYKKDVSMRGKPCKLVVDEWGSGDSVTRAASIVFEGKAGKAFLIAQGNAKSWNSKLLADLIASFK